MAIGAIACADTEIGDTPGETVADTTINPEDEMTEHEKRQLVSDGIP